MVKFFSVCLTSAALGGAACSSATTATRAHPCALSHSDSAFLVGGPVYRDCAVDHAARLRNPDVRIDFRAAGPPPQGTACYNAVLLLVIGTNGLPEAGSARIVQSNDAAFANALLATAPEYRYTPAQKNGAAVRQIVQVARGAASVVVVVKGGGGPPSPSMMPHC